MNNEQRHNQIGKILQVVIATNPDCREKIINDLCQGDAELESEVRSLLEHESQANDLLGSPLVDANTVIDYRPEVQGSGTIQIPGFTLKKTLGQGSSSIVYHAIQENPQREVAIKVLRPLSCSQQATSRIQAEAHLLARLEHPAIARIYQVGVIESHLHAQPFLVMEYAQGQPLSSYLKDKNITFHQRINLILELCEIFEYAHKNGVVHRDIKPSNILIHKDPDSGKLIPTVIDFGIAKLIHGQAIPIDIQTINPEIFGTLRYMSPERRNGKSSGDTVSSDIYSLGVLAAEVLDGTLCCEHSKNIYNNQSNDSSPTFPKPIAQALCRMIHPDPAMRYETVQGAADSLLNAVQASNQPSSGFESFTEKSPLTKITSRATAIVALVATVMILPGSVFVNDFTYLQEIESGYYEPEPGSMTEAMKNQNLEFQDSGPSDKYSVLHAHIRLIGEHARNGYHEDARRWIDIVESQYGDLRSVPNKLQQSFLHAKGYALGSAGNKTDALQAYLSATDTMSLDGELTERLAGDWRGIAHGIQSSGDYKTARTMYQQLIDHPSFNKLKWSLKSTVLANFAGLYWLEEDFQTAEQMFRRVIDSQPEVPTFRERKDIGQFHNSLGVVLTSQNKLKEGEHHINHALELTMKSHRVSDPVMCRMYRNLAKNYIHQGKYEESISIMISVRSYWAAMPDSWPRYVAEADFLLGSAYLKTGRLEQALSCLNNANEICAKLEGVVAKKLLSNIQNALGAALCDSGDTQQGKALMLSSSRSLMTMYSTQNPWINTAMQRNIAHKDCK